LDLAIEELQTFEESHCLAFPYFLCFYFAICTSNVIDISFIYLMVVFLLGSLDDPHYHLEERKQTAVTKNKPDI
jgi:hypothetical protein